MNGVLERTLAILELLSRHGEGMELAAIADQLNIPRSAVHRLLADLMRCGYVRQTRDHGEYLLTTKLIAMGLSFLSNSGIVDISQPLLDRLAEVSGELVRLSVRDGNRLTWVARAQGARQGLRYDPDMGADARMSCSASGLALMAALRDEEALALLAQQGLGKPEEYGPNAPTSIQEVMALVEETRQRGFSITEETYTPGLNAMGAVVRLGNQPPLGVITIAGPSVRFTRARMLALGDELLALAGQLGAASGASPFFNKTMPRPAEVSVEGVSGRKPIYAP